MSSVKKKIAISFLLCLILLGAFGKTSPALAKNGADSAGQVKKTSNPLAEDDAAIRRAMKEDDFGLGEKLALYQRDTDWYSFDGAYLPESLRADVPEEIGAFVVYYEKTGAAEPAENGVWVCLQRAADGVELNDAQLLAYHLEDVDESTLVMTDMPTELGVWLRDQADRLQDGLLQDRMLESLNRDGTATIPAGGKKLVGYDLDKETYTLERIPIAARAKTQEELGYIISYRIQLVPFSAEYKNSGSVSGMTEKMEATVIEAASGEELGSLSIGGKAPPAILITNGQTTDIEVNLGHSEIEEELNWFWFQHGLKWPGR